MLDGTDGDVGEAYEAMTIGFKPDLHKGAIAEASQESLDVLKTRSKSRKPIVEESEEADSMQVEMDDSINPLFSHFDQNGLPPGSISSGKALSVMADVLNNPPSRQYPDSRASAISPKSIRFTMAGDFSSGLTSTPIIDRESQIVASGDDKDSSSSSEDTSSSESSSSEEESEAPPVSDDTSTSGSDSDSEDSSSGSSSDSDDEPQETSSKPSSIANTSAQRTQKLPKSSTEDVQSKTHLNQVVPGSGTSRTKARNERRRNYDRLDRYKKNGILPAGTTLAELRSLKDLDGDTLPEDALAALEEVRSTRKLAEVPKITSKEQAKIEEFEARRTQLLRSLESGGVDVDGGSMERSSKESSNTLDKPHNPGSRSVTTTPSKRAPTPHQKAPERPLEFSIPSKEASNSPSKAFEPVTASATPSRITSISPSKAQRETEMSISFPKLVSQLPTISSAEGESSVAVTVEPILNPLSAAPESQQPTHSGKASVDTNMLGPSTSKDATTRTTTQTPSTSSARGSGTLARHSKVDIGASRRLLFGALGMRTPKTKKDEDKIRSNLMKDVRPLVAPKSVEGVSKDAEDAAEEDPDAWREKINYRAVECCHDDVVLSEPPFPFVQRWDPQQQGRWPQKGKRGGKRKQDMRDQSQLYETQQSPKKQKQRKDKHNYAEEQEYIDASYEPSYQDNSMDLSYDEPTQNTTFSSDNIDGEVSQQLLNDLNENASAATSQGPEDLAPLPSDPSTLPDLQEGKVTAGMTIAFKQLDMSEETRWSPLISAWRTAIVIATLENGDLRLSLALRDRKSREKNYDEYTGGRVYSRFEMPTESDEEDEEADDDGTFDVGYKTLFAVTPPKIVQDAPAELAAAVVDETSPRKDDTDPDESVKFRHRNENESAEAQLSHVTETPLHSDTPELPKHYSTRASESHEPENGESRQTEVEEHGESPELLDEEFHEAMEVVKNLEETTGQQVENDNEFERDVCLEEEIMSPVQEDSLPEANANDTSWNGFEDDEPSTLTANVEVTTACPICDASLVGVTPDLASAHVNGCLDGNPIYLPGLVPCHDAVSAVATPSKGTDVPQDKVKTTETVSDENRQEISQMIKDAGFRSSVPSSVMKNIRLEGMESPGDTAALEQLRKEMADLDNGTPYSPEYRGLDSSPTRVTRQTSTSPIKTQLQGPSPVPVTQSSWQTVDSQMPSSPPDVPQTEVVAQSEPEKEDGESWETLEDPASPPTKLSKKRNSRLSKILEKSSGLSDARKRWEAMQTKNHEKVLSCGGNRMQSPLLGARSRENSVLSMMKDSTPVLQPTSLLRQSCDASPNLFSPLPEIETVNNESDISSAAKQPGHLEDGADDQNNTPTVRYPKLSIGSSFTSQISDHGRQPDIIFEDSPDANANTTTTVPLSGEDDSYRPDDIMVDVEENVLSSPISDNDEQSDEEEIVPNSPNSDSDSNSDTFPSLKRLSQLSQGEAPVKTEKEKAKLPQLQRKNNMAYRKAMDALDDEELSDEDQVVPKASQNNSHKPLSKVPLPRNPSSPASVQGLQTWPYRRSQPPASQPIGSASQVIDLTHGNSDNESEEANNEDDAGWVKKRASSQAETSRRIGSETSLRASSQASLNTRHGKKNSRY
jgi:hypothetical protein